MKARQLTTNVLAFAAGRPALHSKTMADIVSIYLKEACPAQAKSNDNAQPK
jgi:hypothetical protein